MKPALIVLCIVLCGALIYFAVPREPAAEVPATPSAAKTVAMASAAAPGAPAFNFPDANMPPTPGWTGPVFKLSQNYPPAPPPTESYPWKSFDFKTQWAGYLNSVLNYCKQGNLDVDWVVQNNPVRVWYHAPWLHYGASGREFVHGLTRERNSRPRELAPTQASFFQNWAVGMYSVPGGYVLGQVWQNPTQPNPSASSFPEGTVSIKLLFTQATVAEVPYLQGAKEWEAYIYKDPNNPAAGREIQKLRLLQIDLAVRDSRADDSTGWVFGTFTYNGNLPGDDPWAKMVPVGIMWGNDPTVTSGSGLKETIINASQDLPPQHLGWNKRLNGPVDNPRSSCLSCHGTSQWTVSSPMTPPRETPEGSAKWMCWFRNIQAGTPFDPGCVSLDYSLQIAFGMQNLYSSRGENPPSCAASDPCTPGAPAAPATAKALAALEKAPAKAKAAPRRTFPVIRD